MNQQIKALVELKKREGVPNFVIRNFLKEYLQYPALEFIYGQKKYNQFVFTGGSCLRICFGLPRLSEDLDFDLFESDWENFNLAGLADDLKKYFADKMAMIVETRVQGEVRVYLKFSGLRALGLAGASESDLLYVKFEPNKMGFNKPVIEVAPISRMGYNFVAKRYSLELLMTGKLSAIFNRTWFKSDENEVNIKGRDFYDLFWYLDKGVSPEWKNLQKQTGIGDWAELKKQLKEKIEKDVTTQKLAYDLKNFFPDQIFVNEFCKNYKKIIFGYLDRI